MKEPILSDAADWFDIGDDSQVAKMRSEEIAIRIYSKIPNEIAQIKRDRRLTENTRTKRLASPEEKREILIAELVQRNLPKAPQTISLFGKPEALWLVVDNDN